MGSAGSLTQDFLTALVGAIASGAFAAASGFLITRIPRVRQWFAEGGQAARLLAMFLISVIVAGGMGLFLRHLTWQEVHPLKQALDGFAIVAGGRVDATGKVLSGDTAGPFKFTVEHPGPPGQYTVIFTGGSTLPGDKIVLVNSSGDAKGASANLVVAHSGSLQIQTLINNGPADAGFGFLVMHRESSP